MSELLMDQEVDMTKAEGTAEKKKPRTKFWVILGIVAAVLGAGVVGGLIWHEQPSFCNAICHKPMDTYVKGYYSKDLTLLVTAHAAAKVACLDCHVPTLSQQLGEGVTWIKSDYQFDAQTKMLKTRDFATAGFCLSSKCHDMSAEELTASTKSLSFNPHNFSQHGVPACGECHKVHQQSVVICAKCHSAAEAIVPDGWGIAK
ncbi:MAG: cytochrome c3 family protein [Coriobacteriia bacterium]